MTEVVSGDNWSYKTCKLQGSISSPLTVERSVVRILGDELPWQRCALSECFYIVHIVSELIVEM